MSQRIKTIYWWCLVTSVLGTLRRVSLKVLAAVDMAGAARRLRLRPANLATVNNDIFASAKITNLV